MAEPPSELGAEKLIVAKASPAETVTFRGVPGKVKVETGLLGPLLPPPHAVKKTTAAQKIQGNLFMFIKLLEFYSHYLVSWISFLIRVALLHPAMA